MATTSLVRLSTPAGSDAPEIVVLVHHTDEDVIVGELAKMISRDGYPAVHRTFSQQPSRHWTELFAGAGEPVQVEDSDLPVPGFGIVSTGDKLLTAAQIGDGSQCDWQISYLVKPDGKVSHRG